MRLIVTSAYLLLSLFAVGAIALPTSIPSPLFTSPTSYLLPFSITPEGQELTYSEVTVEHARVTYTPVLRKNSFIPSQRREIHGPNYNINY
ncbi:hypothetical protein F5880DRAFT_156409 [Lentinula raphanica]|nr:hypothetical protein F5880DRAFT_156409 [Lentinula raphanica]